MAFIDLKNKEIITPSPVIFTLDSKFTSSSHWPVEATTVEFIDPDGYTEVPDAWSDYNNFSTKYCKHTVLEYVHVKIEATVIPGDYIKLHGGGGAGPNANNDTIAWRKNGTTIGNGTNLWIKVPNRDFMIKVNSWFNSSCIKDLTSIDNDIEIEVKSNAVIRH